MTNETGALSGIVVADFGRVLAAPYATMLLGDLGADVIKIERPGTGDETRGWGPPYTPDGRSTYFEAINRNKTSRALDLKSDADLAAARELAERADVVVQNFLPGTMEKLGLGYDDLRLVNPGVIYCSVSGFGQQSTSPGYDLLIQATGGLMSVTGPSPDEPTKAGVALIDVLTGVHAAVGIIAALFHRERTGQGQRVDIDLMSTSLATLVNQASGYLLAGNVPRAMGNAHPSLSPYDVYQAADKPMVIACGNDAQFRSLATVVGAPELADDPRFVRNVDRTEHAGELTELLNQRLSGRAAQEWCEALAAQRIAAGPINNVADAFAYAESMGLTPVQDCAGTPVVANPINLSQTPVTYRLAPPKLSDN
ncbi:crotonobetainyl-CoA:carnitine CoA-transferase CaiB-like acyl-CoA transferase [Branchiibius hedensis]|uniref:Crotonobetainyl-CoA:carnitine CoA-transferase CaiB n=1 Tax=Branchiibius hedensis TaxID=672460 RepID=A0A2Y8ZUU1_9MICO|nr:CoA transferase [Branchiibius hedensis]PWJ26894.1 crotonobetainyl-CoA:carnitine CoA-transferase CaiB-like acyl-CoA transferase [Branchiibius hedensis]SSA35705.1 Crotonobetainyl-CoA:carnitine CoA-transferase CaiB [Branchiibius hedensis]